MPGVQGGPWGCRCRLQFSAAPHYLHFLHPILGFVIVTDVMSCGLSPLGAQKTSWKKHKTPFFTQEPAQSSSIPPIRGCFGVETENKSKTISSCSQDTGSRNLPPASSERVNPPSVCWTWGVHHPRRAWGTMINSWGHPFPSTSASGAQLGSSGTHLLSIIFRWPCHVL